MLRQFLRSSEGATLAYVALILVVMVGMIGLAYDLGRIYVVRSELQKAADAAAVAGAYQLNLSDDQVAVAARVSAAVNGAAITANQTRIATATGDIAISGHRILETIPADDDTAIAASDIGPPYNYVEVTTEIKNTSLTFMRVLGATGQPAIQATAVAGRGEAVCRVPPLMMCNPQETAGSTAFNPDDLFGKQIWTVQQSGSGTGSGGWVPGNFGLLDVGQGNGTPTASLAALNGANTCISSGVDTSPGSQTQPVRWGMNVRFGMYDGQASSLGNANNVANNPPAQNFASYPRDAVFTSSRIGDGNWGGAEAYWNATHAGSGTSFLASGLDADATRWEIYRKEIELGLIPDATQAPLQPGSSSYVPTASNLLDDRRIITIAVVNCTASGVNGNSTGVPVVGYLNGFMTEPMAEPPNSDLYLEIIGSDAPPGAGTNEIPVPTRDWVEIVR